jgi:tetraprenyl-beta-curcumene synthase
VWGLPAVAREVRAWRARALEIPDLTIREDALSSLDRKRGNAEGAALFWTIPRARNFELLRLLVACQILWDFLDSLNERGVAAGQANGRQLHLALVGALDPNRPISDYYRHHPWCDDGGYLRALVEACRESCAQLPSYRQIRTPLVQEATRAVVQGINHELNPLRRDRALRDWAVRERYQQFDVDWFELTAAASASLTVYALLALGAEPSCTELEIERTRDAYFPWIASVSTMLDSYVDYSDDTATGDHIYIAHYGGPEFAALRIRRLIQRSISAVGALPGGERHELIVACMVSMYLSKDSARTREIRATTASFVNAGGSLTKILLPVLRLWSTVYALRYE